MTEIVPGQLDLLDLLEPERPPAPIGGPAEGFRLDLTPEQYADLQDETRKRYPGEAWGHWRGWTFAPTGLNPGSDNPHVSAVHTADLRTSVLVEGWQSKDRQDVGALYYRVWCQRCQWWTGVHDNENDAVRDYLDHCWSGWRDLPVLCNGGNHAKKRYKLPADYPDAFKAAGAPWKDCRHDRRRARDHPDHESPFKANGYSIGWIDPDCRHTYKEHP